MSPKKQRVYLFDKEMSSDESLSGNYIECHITDTYQAEIYVGFNPGYEPTQSDDNLNMNKVKNICRFFCNKHSLAVSVEATSFIYKNGSESGAKIRFINYPRYPVSKSIILTRSLLLAEILKNEFSQYRVSVITTDKTYMLGNIE